MRGGKGRSNRQHVADELRTLIREARALVEPLEGEAFNRRPPDGGWSVAECLDHLNATARLYLPVLAEAIDDARARGLVDGRRDGRTLLGRVVAWSQEPPVRFRMKTYDSIRPEDRDDGAASSFDRDDLLEDFATLHEELIVRVNESSDLDAKRVKIRSVLDRRLRLSLGDWFAFLAAHGRRHLWQAEQVIQANRAPTTAA